MNQRWAIALFFIFSRFTSIAIASNSGHIILKDDLNKDGVADRVIFASYGTSGLFISNEHNKKIDTFLLRQGNRTILFSKGKDEKSPFVRLTEQAGFFTVVTVLKYENKSFKHVTSYVLPEKVAFSDDIFSSPLDTISTTKSSTCSSDTAFDNKSISSALDWSDAIKKYSTTEVVKKSIDPNCKSVMGDEYDKLEQQIISACSVGNGKPEANHLISCLDNSKYTQTIAGVYKQSLAQNIFQDGFKISCQKSTSTKPLASFSSSTNVINFFQSTPADKSRNFEADFFHEMIHAAGIKSEADTSKIVNTCLGNSSLKNINADDMKPTSLQTSSLSLEGAVAEKKEGIEVNIPSTAKTVPQTSVASAVSEGSKAMDNNFSMDNETQYDSLSKVSQATFKSFDPIMKAAYQAAVPTAFAQGSIEIPSGGTASTATTTSVATVKAAGSSRSIASTSTSGATYDVSNLPDSVPASANGELGNGLSVKATTVSAKAAQPRNPASSGSGGETGTSSTGGSGGGTVGSDSVGYKPTTDRPDLRNNVPQLKAEEDFVKTLTTGKYEDVKARLTDPKNQKILEDKRIQYVARDRTLGSKQPVMILKDLGNKFSIVRVTIE